MKHILVFSTAYYPFVGGAEVAVKEITNRLSHDFEFDLITAKFRKDLPKVEKIGAVTIYRLGFAKPSLDKILLPFLGALKALELQKTKNYFCLWGIMITFGSGALYLFNVLRLLSGQKKIPVVLTLQEGDSESHLKYKWGGLIALSWKLALRQTEILTGISNFLLNRAKKNGYKGKYALIPNGVDVSLFSKNQSDQVKTELKEKLGKRQDDVFLVTVSRLVKKNATDDIISALAYLPKNIKLIVIGKGIEGFRLQKQAKDLNLTDRVKFLGFIKYEDLPKYLSVCDIFIRPSRSEGFGNSFIEAMASGLPVIATPVGGIPDFLDDKETGIFCSPDNPQSIAESVKILLENKELVSKITEKAYDMVVSSYSWDHVAKEMKEKVFDYVTKV